MNDTSDLKPSELTAEHFNHLTPTQAELLALLSEECGEVVQIVGKILRHGLSSCHPDGGFPNYRLLESEVGDFLAATRLIASAGMIDMVRVEDAADVKSRKVFKYLHHSSPPASEEKVTCPNCERKGDHYDQRGHYTCEPAEPAPPSEMPEAVREAARILRVASKGYVGFTTSFLGGTADALESWCRSQQTEFAQLEDKIISLATELEALRSQPAPALRMTPELEHVLASAEYDAGYSDSTGYLVAAKATRSAIAAVRAQASQPQGVKLPKVREALITLSGCIYEQENMDKVIAALAELDAAEGRKP